MLTNSAKRQLKQKGDTIVEVLICLAIVGSGLTISYSIARRSLFQIRDAQERGEMLTLAQTELELLKKTLTNDTSHAFLKKVDGVTDDSDPPTVDLLERAFCITSNGILKERVASATATECAIDENGNFYSDCGCSLTDVDAQYPYRVGITYHPKNTTTSPEEQVDEWYVYAGRLGAGGYGNALGFSIVPLMYREHP